MRFLAAILLAAALPAGAQMTHQHGEGGLQWSDDPWTLSVHGFANAIRDHQGGPRGDEKTFSNNMLMVSGLRPLAAGTLELRGMFSLDPAMGRGGYPLLFQTGETANGRLHLVDRQHPHDAFMELSGTYRQPIDEGRAWFVSAGLPGEPALGPPAFMHRPSGERIPEAPISHHWLDSTHISEGVVTLGATVGDWTVDASRFNGHEPDQNRWNLETGRLNSSSSRLTWMPSPEWSMQVSYGHLRNIETIVPNVSERRTTASIMHDTHLGSMRWSSTLAWGLNQKTQRFFHHALPAWMFETTLEPFPGHALFMRAERIRHDEFSLLLPFGKISAGYIVDVGRTGPIRWGVGALGSYLRPPTDLLFFYGDHPVGYMVFLQARL